MEVPYFVMHPSVGVTAVVHAPSTEKARTTFLDWLERNGHLRRADRQLLRKNMVANRLEDANVQSDVVLHYGYQDVGAHYPAGPGTQHPLTAALSSLERLQPGRMVEQPDIPTEGVSQEPWKENPWPEEPSTVEMLDLPREEPGPKMPIQKVMLRGL